jgi:hypothetical protein
LEKDSVFKNIYPEIIKMKKEVENVCSEKINSIIKDI